MVVHNEPPPPVLVKGRLRLFRFFSKISHLLHRPFLLPKSNSLFGNPILGQTHCVFTILYFLICQHMQIARLTAVISVPCEAFEEYSRFNHIRYYLSFLYLTVSSIPYYSVYSNTIVAAVFGISSMYHHFSP